MRSPRSGPVPGVLGRVAARAYGWEIGRRNRRYDAGRGVVRFDRPVISVGNLSVGGTGKTPMVAHVVEMLQAAGNRPCIAMRGYKSRGGISDEAEEYRRRFVEVPVVARADRTQGLIELFATDEGERVDVVVLDDGFQHRRIARDLDIVVIDATRSPFVDALLPAGWLREPVSSLARAQCVVLSHAECAEPQRLAELDAAVGRVRGGREAEAVTRHAWSGVVVHSEGAEKEEPVSWLRGKRIVAACAIGNPGAFLREAARAVGGPLVSEIVLRDHDPFGRAALERIGTAARLGKADAVLVTEKDWAKIGGGGENRRSWKGPCLAVRARLQLSFDRGGVALREAVLAAAARVEAEAT